ncbi:MAG TPA: DUF484 family protein [Burkholderiaceae bacterium]|nr:DUF484 family protein [Burkholderiaceae bacterium]
MSTNLGTQGITEADIANFLANTPGFFERHAELLGAVQLTSPHGQRAVSLQERQMEMLRDKIKGLEGKIIEMIRNAQDNLGLADRLHRWTLEIMRIASPAAVPDAVVQGLMREFQIPQAAIRVWGADEPYAGLPFAQAVGTDAKTFATSLSAPYCGVNAGFEAAQWFAEPAQVMSLALVPLRAAAGAPAFGMLVLGSPDPTRYSVDMGTDFLVRVGEIASAGLARLLGPSGAGSL